MWDEIEILGPVWLVTFGSITVFWLIGKPLGPAVWWLVAVLLLGIGDVATTWYAVRNEDIEEGNPFLRGILGESPTLMGLVISHVLGFAVVFLGYVVLDAEYAIYIPVGLSGMGAYAVTNNLYQIVR